MTEVERMVPSMAGTDWSAIFTSTLIPLTVAAGFVYFALDPSQAADWARGLLALIPLEYFRAFVFYILSDTYREYRSPMQAVRFFLVSLAILIVIALVIEPLRDQGRLVGVDHATGRIPLDSVRARGDRG